MGYRSGVAVSCAVGRRCGSDPALLWFCPRPEATAPIQPLAWESPCAAGVALKDKKTKMKKYRLDVHRKKNVQFLIFYERGPD